MKLLITGGYGFLGSNLAAAAMAQGLELIVFDNLSRGGSCSNKSWLEALGNFRSIHGDIRSNNDIEQVIQSERPDAIFHLAGQVAMTTSIENPRNDFEVNALGTLNLLEAVRLHVPKAAVIYSSTNKVYGALDQYRYEEADTRYLCLDRPTGFDESTMIEFHSPYGCSKGCADQYMMDYARIFGLNTVVFRHSSMYGDRQFATYNQGWVGWFCQKAAELASGADANRFTISGTGKQVRDVLHVDDMVSLYFRAVEQIRRARGEAFNIGGGISNSLSLLELFSLLEEYTDTHLKFERLAERASDQRVFVADIHKAKRLLDWEPRVSKREGIEKMLQWIREIQ